MSPGQLVADRLENAIAGGFDTFKVSKEAFSIYQESGLSLTKNIDMALLSLIAMEEGPEFEMTEKEFQRLLAEIRHAI
jgi:hypothetical protein